MPNNVLKLPNEICLHCKQKGYCITDSEKIETVDGLIIRPVICTHCRQSWKDFYGATSEDSPVISIQRNTSSNSSE